MNNMIGGKIEQVDRETFIKLFDIEIQYKIEDNINRSDVDGIVYFVNMQMDSSNLGMSTGLIYGPGCTYKTAEEICKGRLGDLPSRFQYPTKIYIKEKK